MKTISGTILFAGFAGLVSAQVGLTFVDDNLREIFEPRAAGISDRLKTLRNLVGIGVITGARADPLIHGITDSDRDLRKLFSAIAKTGVKEIAVNYLFLRPAIKKSIKENVSDKRLLNALLEPYFEGPTLPIGLKNSRGVALPKEMRREAFKRIKNIGSNRVLAMTLSHQYLD